MKIFPALVISTFLSIALSENVQYGTQVNSVWYDRIALQYQSPPIGAPSWSSDKREAIYYGSTGTDNTWAIFPEFLYERLSYSVYIGPASSDAPKDSGVFIFTNPSAEEAAAKNLNKVRWSECYLQGEAAIVVEIMRQRVLQLDNLIENETLKKIALSIGEQDRVYLSYLSLSSLPMDEKNLTTAVAISKNKRIQAEEITVISSVRRTGSNVYTNLLLAEFSVKKLMSFEAIQKGKVIFQHGWQKSDFCTFDLAELP